jgi:hypothetical protein
MAPGVEAGCGTGAAAAKRRTTFTGLAVFAAVKQ